MKRLFFALVLGFLYQPIFAQTVPDFEAVKLEVKEDFNSAANDAALQAANYIFNTPLNDKDLNRLNSIRYIIKWMTGTPDYSFTFDEKAAKFAQKNDDFLALYMAAMTKYVLTSNAADAKDQDKIKLNALKSVIAYAKDKKNNVKINKELKKIIEADDKGQLEEYIKK